MCVCVSLSLPATFSSKCSETAMAMSRAASTYAVPSYNATPDLSVKGVPPSLLSPEGSRLDGRLPHECRPACLCPTPTRPALDRLAPFSRGFSIPTDYGLLFHFPYLFRIFG